MERVWGRAYVLNSLLQFNVDGKYAQTQQIKIPHTTPKFSLIHNPNRNRHSQLRNDVAKMFSFCFALLCFASICPSSVLRLRSWANLQHIIHTSCLAELSLQFASEVGFSLSSKCMESSANPYAFHTKLIYIKIKQVSVKGIVRSIILKRQTVVFALDI